ncbi:hypothetical protein ABQF34_22370 [Mycolicibacterium boenickei]
MAQELRCDPDGLRAFSLICAEQAESVQAVGTADVPQAPHQATTDAVSNLYSAASGLAQILAERITATGAALTIAAEQYAQTDEGMRQALTASMNVNAW